MRFHCGISFSWRSIKRFIIPIIIGLLAFFGFNFIYDNRPSSIGVIQTYALEDYNPLYNEYEEQEYYSYYSQYDEVVDHKPLYNKIYWFDDNTTTYGVLCSIYELLLLYCLGMFVFRILTFIKNTRW